MQEAVKEDMSCRSRGTSDCDFLDLDMTSSHMSLMDDRWSGCSSLYIVALADVLHFQRRFRDQVQAAEESSILPT